MRALRIVNVGLTPGLREFANHAREIGEGFGITRPSDAQRRLVTLLLGGVLLTVGLLVIAIAVGMVLYLHGSR